MLTRSSPLLILPTYSSIVIGVLPTASTRVGLAINVGIASPSSFDRQVARFHTLLEPVRLERPWLVFADDINFRLIGNPILHPDGPIASIDQQPAQPFALQ